MTVLRTPDSQFQNLPGYAFEPCYTEIEDSDVGTLRVHYVDQGDKDAEPIILMHGEPSWSYLYRKMIPVLVAAGHRAIAVDLVGFGRSDKLSDREDYTYAKHVAWMQAWFDKMDVSNATLVCQDWGGLIGLRLVAANPQRFARVVAANTMLPTGDHDPGESFLAWKKFSQEVPDFNSGRIVSGAVTSDLSEDIIAAYNAPFPDDSYKAAARQFPTLVPVSKSDPERDANLAAWEVLKQFNKPFLTAFSDSDPITKGGEKIFQKLIPGCAGQSHSTVIGGGHFLQEDQGEQLAEKVVDFMQNNPL